MSKRKIKKFKKCLNKNAKKILAGLACVGTILVTTKECIEAVADVIANRKK